MKFSKVPKFFLEKNCKKETKRRGLQGPVGLLHLTLRFFCSSPQWQRRRVGLADEAAYGKSDRVILPQRLCQWHLFVLFCLRAAVPKIEGRLVVCVLVCIFGYTS
jgi:hypothetical protein